MPWKEHKIEKQIEITDIYSLFEYHFDNNWNFEGESHDFWECVYVIDGEIRVSGDGRVYTLKSGEMIFHKPMEFHKLSLLGLNEANVFIFSYKANGILVAYFFDKVFTLSESQKNIVFELLTYLRNNNVSPKEKTDKEFWYLYNKENDKTYLQTVANYLQILLLSLSNGGKTAELETTPDAVILRNAVNFMKSNLASQVNAEEVAKNANTSLSTLKRIFAKFVGIPIHRYYLILKIQYATELLQSGKSVTETAYTLGFSSQSHFTKIYKKIAGKNPSESK